jgi:ankyrin repeat protein
MACKVQVKAITGASLFVTLNLDARLADLKAQVEQKLHIPSGDQTLLLHGAPLVDGDAPWTATEPPLQLEVRRQPRSTAIPALLEASCLSGINSRVWGKTALHFALEAGNAVACLELLQSPVFSEVNASDPDGYTPLHLAADRGFAPACEAIIRHPDFSKVLPHDRRGRTALHCAAASGLDSVVKALLDDQPSEVLNAKDDMGKSALHHAITAGQDHTCVALLERADCECVTLAREDFGMTPGVLGGVAGEPGADGTRGLPSGRRCTALHCAAFARMWRSCLEMLKRREFEKQVNALDQAGRTPLHYAAERGLTDVCLAILESPMLSEINALDNQQCTAFECAAKKGVGKVCAAFAVHPGFEVNMRMGAKQSTALHLAVEHKHSDACFALLKREDLTEMNALDTQRPTALHYAAHAGMREFCVAMLIEPSFTQSRARDVHGKTALEGAQGFLAADVWREVYAARKPDDGSAAPEPNDR